MKQSIIGNQRISTLASKLTRLTSPTTAPAIQLLGLYFVIVIGSLFTDGFVARQATAQESDSDLVSELAAEELAQSAWELSSLILLHHVDAPSRPEMMLQAIRAMYRRQALLPPADLSEQCSAASSPAEIHVLIESAIKNDLKPIREDVTCTAEELQAAFMNGLLHAVPGSPMLQSGRDYAVAQSLAENRYVGIGIILSLQDEWPIINKPFPGGPAKRGGALPMDRITSIDGDSTQNMPLTDVIERLRGALGTELEVGLQTGEQPERLVAMTRTEVPIASVEGSSIDSEDRWHYNLSQLVDSSQLEEWAYLKFVRITGSTAQELRQAAREIERSDFEAVIIDLRDVNEGNLHHTVMVADALLAGGLIGHVRGRDRVTTYRAREEAVLREIQIVLLVNERIGPHVQWLAAAIQDNRRGIVVGANVRTNGFCVEDIPMSRDAGVLQSLPVGYYLRGDHSLLSSLLIPGEDSPTQLANQQVRRATSAGLMPDHQVPSGTLQEDAELFLTAAEALQESLSSSDTAADVEINTEN